MMSAQKRNACQKYTKVTTKAIFFYKTMRSEKTRLLSVNCFEKLFKPHFLAASDLPRSLCFLAGSRGKERAVSS